MIRLLHLPFWAAFAALVIAGAPVDLLAPAGGVALGTSLGIEAVLSLLVDVEVFDCEDVQP